MVNCGGLQQLHSGPDYTDQQPQAQSASPCSVSGLAELRPPCSEPVIGPHGDDTWGPEPPSWTSAAFIRLQPLRSPPRRTLTIRNWRRTCRSLPRSLLKVRSQAPSKLWAVQDQYSLDRTGSRHKYTVASSGIKSDSALLFKTSETSLDLGHRSVRGT